MGRARCPAVRAFATSSSRPSAAWPQSGPGPGGGRTGLGWIITPRGDVASHAGANLDATAAVTTRIRDQRTHVVLTTRMIPVNSIETRLLRAWTNP